MIGGIRNNIESLEDTGKYVSIRKIGESTMRY